MEKVLQSFMNENDATFAQFFEKERETRFRKREDFYEIRDAKREIYEEYPAVRELFEDEKAKGYSNEEIDAINEILRLESMKTTLEIKEAFKLGAREAYVFFKEQNMLKI